MFVESFYSDTYESGWTGVYRKLTNEYVTEVSTKERRLVIGMVSSLFFRNLSWKRFYDQFMGDMVQRGFDLAEANGKDRFTFEGEEVSIKGQTVDLIKSELWEKDKPGFIVTQTRAAIKLLQLRFDSDGIEIMKIQNSNGLFITSDRPVAPRDPDNQRIVPMNPKNFMSLPVDHKHMLLLIPERPKQNMDKIYRSVASDVDLFVWNTQQFGLAHKYLMGSETGLQQYCDVIRRVNSKRSGDK